MVAGGCLNRSCKQQNHTRCRLPRGQNPAACRIRTRNTTRPILRAFTINLIQELVRLKPQNLKPMETDATGCPLVEFRDVWRPQFAATLAKFCMILNSIIEATPIEVTNIQLKGVPTLAVGLVQSCSATPKPKP